MRIAIVGGGATGVIAACQLLDHFKTAVDITIYEPATELGAGIAYGAQDPALILNVPLSRMGYSPDKKNDFENYMRSAHPEVFSSHEFPYVSRRYYREYLQGSLRERATFGAFKHLRQRVVALQQEGDLWRVESEDSSANPSSQLYDHIFVANGYRRELPFCGGENPRIISCFDEASIKAIPEGARVFIAGTGLSTIDAWRLLRLKKNITITAVSRRGQWPVSHLESPQELNESWEALSPRQVFRKARFLHQRGIAWPNIADSFRPQLLTRWSAWTPSQRKSFFRHLRPFWELIRHRLPPTVFAELQTSLLEGSVHFFRAEVRDIKGAEVRDIKSSERAVQVTLRIRAGDTIETRDYDFAIVATGAPVNEQFVAAKANLKPYLLGPVSKSLYWEVTAVPEISEQIHRQVLELDSLRR